MLIGYRCKVCGAPVDPETGYCKYCDTLNFKPIVNKHLKDEKPRIIIRDGYKEVEINPLRLSLTVEEPQMIEVTSMTDTTRRFIPGIVDHGGQYARFSVSIYNTNNANDILTQLLTQPVFDVVFTGFRQGYAHEFKGYMENLEMVFSVNPIAETKFDIVSVNPVDLWNTRKIHNPIMEGMKCPICGAPLDPDKSKCDYCGYWWIYSPEEK